MGEPCTLPLELRIRRCTAPDLPLLEWFGLYACHREIIREAFRRQQIGENLMLVAEANRFPAGQVWIDLARERASSTGVLWALRVLPSLQGMGIGSLLIAAAERALRERGYERAGIAVEDDNEGARLLYERLGYQEVRRERCEYSYRTPDGEEIWRSEDHRVLQKQLTGDTLRTAGASPHALPSPRPPAHRGHAPHPRARPRPPPGGR